MKLTTKVAMLLVALLILLLAGSWLSGKLLFCGLALTTGSPDF